MYVYGWVSSEGKESLAGAWQLKVFGLEKREKEM
jgi:hypothetical protein